MARYGGKSAVLVEYFYSKTTDLSQSGILEQIPSAYYTSGGYKRADEQNPELEKYIPAYMMPKTIKIIDKLPINKNGKIDRKALSEL